MTAEVVSFSFASFFSKSFLNFVSLFFFFKKFSKRLIVVRAQFLKVTRETKHKHFIYLFIFKLIEPKRWIMGCCLFFWTRKPLDVLLYVCLFIYVSRREMGGQTGEGDRGPGGDEASLLISSPALMSAALAAEVVVEPAWSEPLFPLGADDEGCCCCWERLADLSWASSAAVFGSCFFHLVRRFWNQILICRTQDGHVNCRTAGQFPT